MKVVNKDKPTLEPLVIKFEVHELLVLREILSRVGGSSMADDLIEILNSYGYTLEEYSEDVSLVDGYIQFS